VTGIANQDSIACSIARARKAFGADLATIYLNDKTGRRKDSFFFLNLHESYSLVAPK
jgi:enoyl-[acyl-carrier-protein] reductase (NADH)